MRNIKFRGKSLVTGEWVYGSLLTDGDAVAFIVETFGEDVTFGNGLFMNDLTWHRVDETTVGQYIDVYLDGEDLFEGDILKFKHENASEWDVSVIVYFGELGEMGTYPAFDLDGGYIRNNHFESHVISYIWESSEFEIIKLGNIHDNLNLLDQEETV